MRVEVRVAYRNYRPPVDVAAAVKLLVSYVPRQYLKKLGRIVLANSSGLNRSFRHAKTWSHDHKVRLYESGGLYFQERRGSSASIVLLVDNIIHSRRPLILKFPPVRNHIFAEVLYHEIGHHINMTACPEYTER